MANMELEIKKGIYKHFKGNEYEVIDIGFHSETQEPFVVYRALYGEHKLWVRPIDMFLEEVDKGASANTYAPGTPGAKPEIGYKGPRFTYVREK
jgi:hypothetical protein